MGLRLNSLSSFSGHLPESLSHLWQLILSHNNISATHSIFKTSLFWTTIDWATSINCRLFGWQTWKFYICTEIMSRNFTHWHFAILEKRLAVVLRFQSDWRHWCKFICRVRERNENNSRERAKPWKRLHRNTFESLRKLSTIDLFENQLEQIDDDLFAHNRNIDSMWMSNNHLKAINPAAMRVMRLVVDNNQITKLDESSFKLNHELVDLRLSNNILAQLNSKVFDSVPQLRQLYFVWQLNWCDWSQHCWRLEKLNEPLFGRKMLV